MPLPISADARWEELGNNPPSGGQAEAHCVESRETGEAGVLKVLKMGKWRGAFARFKREIEILADVRHPNVARILDWDSDGDRPWLVTERGVPLREYWGRFLSENPSPATIFDRAHHVISDVLSALAVLHARGIVHRDIKPANVVVVEGRAALIDFGIAFLPQGERLTDTEQALPPQNTFSAPPGARYGDERDPAPSWDCLGVAWLWAWLLGTTQPKDYRFHWRFHRFIKDARCNGVRAILALCSHEDTVPKDGKELQALCRTLVSPPHPAGGPANLQTAMEVSRKRKAKGQIEAAAQLDRIEAALPEVLPAFEAVVEHLRALVEQCNASGLEASGHSTLPKVEAQIRQSHSQGREIAVVYLASFGEPEHRLKIRLSARFERTGKPIALVIEPTGDTPAEIFRWSTNGTLRGSAGRTSTQELKRKVTALVENHLNEQFD